MRTHTGLILILTLALNSAVQSETNETMPESLQGNYLPPPSQEGGNTVVRPTVRTRATTRISRDGNLQVTITPSTSSTTTRPRPNSPRGRSTRRPSFTNNHIDKPVCRDRNKWRFIAEKSVMPKVYVIRFLPEIFPELYDFITGPDGSQSATGIPENTQIYRDKCLQLCLNETDFQCRFFAFVHPYLCIEAQHTNEFQTNSGFSNPFFEVPRVCLPNDGCIREGEYFADSFSRCHFYQCSHGGSNTLEARQHQCPPSTVTRESFLTSRDMPLKFTQPCSEFGSECVRTFPRFAP